jgi:hypothetical protein
MWKREWGALRAEEGWKGILPGTVNKQAGPGRRGSGRSEGVIPATSSRKACESGGGRKTPRERGEDPLPT